jgi:hypothetical protein
MSARKLVFLLPLFLVMSGCTMNQIVPKTTMKGTLLGQPYDMEFPKNAKVNGFKLMAKTNEVTVEIKSIETVMDPQVITTSTDGIAKLISTSVAAGAEAAGKIAGAAAK